MSVNLRKKVLRNSQTTKRNKRYKYQLDYMVNGKRIRETIRDVVFEPEDTIEQRKQKKRIITKIKADLEVELVNKSHNLISTQMKKASFILYFENLAKTKTPNTKTAWINTLNHIKAFHGSKLRFEDVTVSWLEKFTCYLKGRLSPNSALTYLQKINVALNYAVKQKIINENPYRYINKPKQEEKEMIYLTQQEIQDIVNTDFFNNEIKNAFLFSCFTGLRFSDIISLKWENIIDNKVQIKQKKTKGLVYIPLNEGAMKILEFQREHTQTVFEISEFNSSVNRTLRKLVKKASINKNVSFHTARHSFATLLISSGVSIFTVQKLLGHKDIESTMIYAKVISEEKEKAINSLPNFNF